MQDTDRSTLRELRRLRRDRRLGDTEWFDVAYRVYLFALVGGAAVVWLSDLVDGVVEDVTREELLTLGPGAAGVAVAVALAVGLRQGAEGGPVSIESGDVRIVLLSPIRRGLALREPTVQRLRSVAFVLAVPAAILGQLIGRDVVGSRAAWAGALGLFAVLVGASTVAVAVLAHAVRLPRPVASVIGAVAIGVQLATTVATWRADADGTSAGAAGAGPFDLAGSIALWGVRQRWIDLVPLVVGAVLVLAALRWCGRLRIEQLERRGRLVSQLRFAATTQDLRTVVLLRRQLSAEVPRPRPWFGGSSGSGRLGPRPAVEARRRPTTAAGRAAEHAADDGPGLPALLLRRGLASFRRFPAARLIRVGALAVAAGVGAWAAVAASPLWAILLVISLFVAGLELVEPLAQEIDHPDRTDGLPVERSRLYTWLLTGPAVGVVIVGIVGAVVVAVLEPGYGAAAAVLAVPVAWAGASGSVVSTVSDAPRPAIVQEMTALGAERGAEQPFSVPEFAGFGNVVSALFPIVCSAVAAVPVLVMRADPSVDTVVRATVGVALFLVVLVWWVRRRDRWAVAVRRFAAEGRAARETQVSR